MDDSLIQWLAERLKKPLPGRAAQARFEPELAYGRHFAPPQAGTRRAAVVMLLCRKENHWQLPLALRPATLSSHGGQIGLPGGVIERGETSAAAALRELQEELGIDPARVKLIGQLSPLNIFVSGFLVEPWLACLDGPPLFTASPFEVAEILEVPLAHLLDRRQMGRYHRQARGVRFTAPTLCFEDHCIWGATAMMLGELMSLLEECRGSVSGANETLSWRRT
jgi:8-oxo-dGTP pyrophosphatase MutT (NUDIX family)